MVLGKLDIHIEKNETRLYLSPIIKIISKWIKDGNRRPVETTRRKHKGNSSRNWYRK
jgi:hypothetical protein